MNLTISVIMPSLNEESNIKRAVENVVYAFETLNISGEIIVVNDGSKDRTEEIVKEMSKKINYLRLISNSEKKGIGASFWNGVLNSKEDVVTMIPGDNECDAYEILRYFPIMQEVDIVIPFVYNKEIRSWSRRIISKLYKGIINLSFAMLLNYQNGTVLYRKYVLDDLTLNNPGFFYQTELLIKSIKMGYLYAEVPYALKQRIGGKSKAINLKSLLRVVLGYFTTVVSIYFLQKDVKSVNPNSVTAKRKNELK
jgi:dolichol-phosphate mannosyltransferase